MATFMQVSCVKVAMLQRSSPKRPGKHPTSETICNMRPTPIRFRSSDLRRTFPRGVATAKQLEASGIPQRTTYHRCLDGGPWRRLLPGVVLLSTGRATDDQLVRAALLLCGDDAVV